MESRNRSFAGLPSVARTAYDAPQIRRHGRAGAVSNRKGNVHEEGCCGLGRRHGVHDHACRHRLRRVHGFPRAHDRGRGFRRSEAPRSPAATRRRPRSWRSRWLRWVSSRCSSRGVAPPPRRNRRSSRSGAPGVCPGAFVVPDTGVEAALPRRRLRSATPRAKCYRSKSRSTFRHHRSGSGARNRTTSSIRPCGSPRQIAVPPSTLHRLVRPHDVGARSGGSTVTVISVGTDRGLRKDREPVGTSGRVPAPDVLSPRHDPQARGLAPGRRVEVLVPRASEFLADPHRDVSPVATRLHELAGTRARRGHDRHVVPGNVALDALAGLDHDAGDAAGGCVVLDLDLGRRDGLPAPAEHRRRTSTATGDVVVDLARRPAVDVHREQVVAVGNAGGLRRGSASRSPRSIVGRWSRSSGVRARPRVRPRTTLASCVASLGEEAVERARRRRRRGSPCAPCRRPGTGCRPRWR